MTSKCVKCGGTMKEGFPLDSMRHNARVGHWAEGVPAFLIFGILRLGGRRKLPITSYRCQRCGYLESYANEARQS